MNKTDVVVKKTYKKHYINPRPRKMTPERLEARRRIAAAILLAEMAQKSDG